jgi:cardiolipin synthase
MKRLIYAIPTLFFFMTLCHAEKLIIEPEMGREPVLSVINHAKTSVDVVMYGFTDPAFMTALSNAKNSGKQVQVLLEKTPYKNEQENATAIQFLQQANINLKWSNPEFKLTHQKTMIIDHHDALIMTFNFTKSTFKNERNFGLLIDDPAMVSEIENVFHADWDYKNIAVHSPNLVWSPTNSREKLLQFIQQAKSSIEIYAQSVTDYKTIGALAHAAKNGIKVEIITSSKPDGKSKKLDYLIHSGVTIHYSNHYYIHAKVIIIDHHLAMLGSMNLTAASIDKNRELSVITQNQDVIQQLEKTFSNDLNGETSRPNSDKKQKTYSSLYGTLKLLHKASRYF